MTSTSGRRSGSSGDSKRSSGAKRRESVYISARSHDRTLKSVRDAAIRDSATSEAPAKRRSPARGNRGPRAGAPKAGRSASSAARAAEQRRSEREARQSAQRRAVRTRAVLAVLAVVAIVTGCVALYRSPLFAVTHVEVAGASNLSEAAVLKLARVPADATLIRFPADEVAKRVETDPWVESVTVSRVFPDGMRIRIVERTPVGMVDTGNAFWLIDATGLVIAKRSSEQTSTTVVIRDVPGLDPKPGRRTTSEPLHNAVAVLGGLSSGLLKQVRSVSAPTVDGTTLYTADRVEIVVGEAVDLPTKVKLIETILNEQRGKVVSIDVRTIDRPTWRGVR